MTFPTPREIDDSLVEVRKAYRLLHDYQRAVLDTMRYIGNRLGLSYRGGYPWFCSASPRNGRGKLDLWAWDWLNMYFYDFTFDCIGKDGKPVFSMSSLLFSDTGFFLGDSGNDKTNVDLFSSPERSETMVAFLLYPEWTDEFGKALETKEALRTLIETKGELPPALVEGKVVSKCASFSDLSDEQSLEAVISGIREAGKVGEYEFPNPQM